MRLMLAAMVCGLVFPAAAQTLGETDGDRLKAVADSVRPALIEALKPVYQGDLLTENVFVGLNAGVNARRSDRNTFVGACSGASFRGGDDNILIGDHTATPTPNTSGFANIGNKLCFWRGTGEVTACPPPEPDCSLMK